MLTTFGLCLGLAVQAGVALANQKWNSKNANAIRDIQRENRENTQKDHLQRDRDKFERSRQLQMQMELESQQEKLRSIDREFINTFRKMAHNATLASHYPLKVSPYIISKSVLPISDAQLGNARQEVLCILTTSNDHAFNSDVLPYLDDALCQTIARYWNASSLNSICYYQNMWDEKRDYCDEDIDNVKAVISSPTMTLTPLFVTDSDGQHRLNLKVCLWGMECECSQLVDTGLVYGSLPASYAIDDIQKLIDAISPLAICIIGQLADVYYWTSSLQAPVLPNLIASGAIELPQALKDQVKDSYAELYKVLSLGCETREALLPAKPGDDARQNAMASLLNFPERSIVFLKSCLLLTEDTETSAQIIEYTVRALYNARTDEGYVPLEQINMHNFNFDDMALVTALVRIAKDSGNEQSVRQLSSLVCRKISSPL